VSEKFEVVAGLCWRSESCPRLRFTAEQKKKKKPAGQKIQYNRERQREQLLILQNNLQAIQLIQITLNFNDLASPEVETCQKVRFQPKNFKLNLRSYLTTLRRQDIRKKKRMH
jgi:hypothetical protein